VPAAAAAAGVVVVVVASALGEGSMLVRVLEDDDCR